MEIKRTKEPAVKAGEHISKLLEEHAGDAVVLLSGGSALDVFEFIKVNDTKPECRTIFIMVDERVSGQETVNNFLQLKKRYKNHSLINNVFDTSAKVNENPELFATRIRKDFFENYYSQPTEPKIFTILGVGPDGHTAGVFPLDKELFAKTYPANSTYVPVQLKGLKIDSRASFTPDWILNSSSVIFGYITGESKKEILSNLINESKKVYERPAELLKLHNNSFLYTDIDS